jgi:hypothetical protein
MADRVISEPGVVLSELAADLHMRVLESSVHGIMAQIPQVVAGYLQSVRQAEQNENTFYGAWPQLAARKAEAGPLVMRFGNAYRQAHPSATPEDFVREVGAMAMVALRIPVEQQVAPQTPQMQAPPPVPSTGFAPANPGAGSVPPASAPKPLNEWEAMQQEFLREDQG